MRVALQALQCAGRHSTHWQVKEGGGGGDEQRLTGGAVAGTQENVRRRVGEEGRGGEERRGGEEGKGGEEDRGNRKVRREEYRGGDGCYTASRGKERERG